MGTSDVSSEIQEHIANGNLISFCVMVSRASVPNISCHIIHTIQDFSNNRYFVFIVKCKQENKFAIFERQGQTCSLVCILR